MLSVYLLPAFLGYLLGSFPTGYLVGRSRGIDIREHGSGNIGATNVVRVLGKKLGYFVFFCDALKGFLAVWLGRWINSVMIRAAWERAERMLQQAPALHPQALRPASLEDDLQSRLAAWQTLSHQTAGLTDLDTILVIVGITAGLACILGHNFPVWLKFKGGKGVATTVGVLLGLMPAAIGVAAVIWVVAFYLSKYVSLASLLGAASLPVTVWFLTHHRETTSSHNLLLWFSVAAAALIFWRHRANITRLLNGTETRFARRDKSAPPAA